MEGESVSQVSSPAGAVFVSYASQDAQAAQRICEALRSAGVEVWFDQSELRGGDAWDRQIRDQIHECRLFIALISAQTEVRDEGYFRREWKLAVDRTHDMAEKKAFLVPVVIDDTLERGASVPEKFHEVQWTRLPQGDTPPAFVERVRRLLSAEPPPGPARPPFTARVAPAVPPETTARVPASLRSKPALWVVVALLTLGALAYLVIDKHMISRHEASPPAASATMAPSAFAPPAHSIAVLPFVNMSGDKEQEYFSDGLTEEILNSLARISELQVSARTSSFYFKGEHADLPTIAHRLNVASVLEGSVRRSGHTIRVTTQLNNAMTGFHLWSATYDRDLGDVLKLQTEIATAVAAALKVTLLGDVGARIELGGTRNPAAFDAYLRGSKPFNNSVGDAAALRAAIAAFTEAIRLDPNYALAFADRALALGRDSSENGIDPAAVLAGFNKALVDAHRAIMLAPDLAEGYRALAYLESATQQYTQAEEAYERSIALAPGNARMLTEYSRFAAFMGRADAGIAAGRRAVALDPLNSICHTNLGFALHFARRYPEAVAAFNDALALEPENARILGLRGLAYYELRDLQGARSSCEEAKPDQPFPQWCLAIVYDKLGRHPDAEAQLAKMQTINGDSSAYQYATIYAQWGNAPKALEWFDTALRVRDPGLIFLKTDPLVDPVRKEPRLLAIERELRFPN
jgi:TolB-like protein/tetratricopeptide (TPR) repeat protein